MNASVWRRQNAMKGSGMHSRHLCQAVVGQIAFQPDPIQIRELANHEEKIRFASREVNSETRTISDEDKPLEGLPFGRMDRAWLIGVIRRLHNEVKGNDLALARKFGLKRSGHIKKYMLDKDGMTPNVETCLRIAGVAGEHPSDVLRAAGHGPVVAVLESSYRDLSRHTCGAKSPSAPKEADHAAPSSRVLADQRARHQLATQIHAAIEQLSRVVIALEEETGATTPAAPGRPRRHRKTG